MNNKALKLALATWLLLLPVGTQAQLIKKSFWKNNIDTVYQQARELVAQKQYTQALPLARELVDEADDNSDYNLLLGKIYIQLHQPQKAEALLLKVLENDPDYKDAYFLAINSALAGNDYQQAIEYADQALQKFPNDLALSIKKLSVYDKSNNFPAGDELALQMIQNYPDNPDAKNAWAGHYEAAGLYYRKKGMLTQAAQSFQNALKIAPDHQETETLLRQVRRNAETPEVVLTQINRVLRQQPNDYSLLRKKLGLLQSLHRYHDAEIVLKKMEKNDPAHPQLQQLLLYQKLQAARYYEHQDPYVLYQAVLKTNPRNREAINKLIALSMDRGVYRNALRWTNYGLTYYPNSFNLLSKKADALELLDNPVGAAEILTRLWSRNPSSVALQNRTTRLNVAAAKYYISQQQTDLAIEALSTALHIKPSCLPALSALTGIYLEKKDNEAALRMINRALQYQQDDEALLVKKASVLANLNRYDQAFTIMERLISRHPCKPEYVSILVTQQMKAGRDLLKNGELPAAATRFKQILIQHPNNKKALLYVLNLESEMKHYDRALSYAQQGLVYYPDDPDFLLKKVALQSGMKNYEAAALIAGRLREKYPYNKTYTDAYVYNITAGYAFQQKKNWKKALAAFKKALAIRPKDTNARYSAINMYHALQQPDSALLLINQGLEDDPDNSRLLRQKAITLADMMQYEEAIIAAKKRYQNTGSDQDLNYIHFLQGKLYHQQFAVIYRQSSYGATSVPFRVLSVAYRNMQRKWDAGLRLNFGSKHSGTALQIEGDLYYKHNPHIYSHLNLAAATNKNIFPQFRFAYSINKSWWEDFETEVGFRLLRLQTEIDATVGTGSGAYRILQNSTMLSGLLGLSKAFGNFWFNLKGYFMFDYPELSRTIQYDDHQYTKPFQDKRRFFQAYKISSRFYMNERQEYIYLIGGLGTSPDDRARVIQIPELSHDWLSQFVSVGYEKTFNYKTTLNGSIGWSNYKITPVRYTTQYAFYLTFIRKF